MYLGVDGGGTRTTFVIVASSGDLLAEYESTGSYYPDIGLEGVRDVFEAGVASVLAAAQASIDDIRHAFFGVPAYGEDSNLLRELEAIPARLFPGGNYRCDNDMLCTWAGSLACQDGISLIAGTGSIGFGRFRGRSSRCGGWGEIFGDEGSAYWIARRGLQLFSRMSDGRTAPGLFYELVRRDLGLASDLDLSALVLSAWKSDRARIADFSRLVTAAAREGDFQAAGIFRAAAEELVEMADSIRQQLAVPADVEVKVSYSGGVFNAGDVIIQPLASGLARRSPAYRLSAPLYSPALGAAYYAALLDDCEAIRDALAADRARVTAGPAPGVK